ncbi:hypothetical protein DOY81_015433, partial [Sarcophaga bullata]
CSRYKLKVRGLSGHGTQIAASVEDPDRSCRVGCQDESIHHRFYLVNGNYGHFPWVHVAHTRRTLLCAGQMFRIWSRPDTIEAIAYKFGFVPFETFVAET